MVIKHNNPTRPREDRYGRKVWARAPYNFVPLPPKIVPAPEPLPDDGYHSENLGFNGWITCEIETCSPTFVRGMLTEDQFEEFGAVKTEELTKEQKNQLAHFFSVEEEKDDGYLLPTIPGSTLRGMIRALVEVIGYGRVRWVADEPAFTFRAVAAPRDDPLRDPYRNIICSFGRNVKAGYLQLKGEDWFIKPALTQAKLNWLNDQGTYIKVKDHLIGSKDIPGFIRFDSRNYHPQLHKVSFNVGVRQSKRGKYVIVNQIGKPDLYEHRGVLVCSGNMLETAQISQKSPRKNYHLVLEMDRDANSIPINSQVVKDYIKGLTTFERDELKNGWGEHFPGCIGDGNPVFYVTDGDQVVQFGHCPNFRVTTTQNWSGKTRASTPHDFVPRDLIDQSAPDFADAIFGWVEERSRGERSGPEKQRAGKVFFSDARFLESSDEGIWYKPDPITPHILSGPKPTTFQHYLVQRDPNNKSLLAHYGKPLDETHIRGHKFYWFKGQDPDIEASLEERSHENQLTRIVPIKPGVRFKFKIHFENLHREELGLLWWALALPDNPDRTLRHQIGMGKPLGMGAVNITPRLVLTDRKNRYSRLFVDNENYWEIASTESDPQPFVQDFENYLVDQGVFQQGKRLAEIDRIQQLLTMMEWRNGEGEWVEWTRYMEIEYGPNKINEYSERPVLPTPQGVVELATNDLSTKSEEIPSREVSDSALSSKRPVSEASKDAGEPSGLPQVWNLVQGVVSFFEDNGDIYIKLENQPEGILGRIRSTRLAEKTYHKGFQITCLVLEISEEFGETIIECEPPEVSEIHGAVINFGLGKSESFGFIQPDEPDNAQEIFVHRNQLLDMQDLEKGQRVIFKIGKGMRGAEAKDVALES